MREEMPDVIVLLPGILGSVLRKDDRDVWAASGVAVLTGLLSGGGSIKNLALGEDDLADDLGDGVTADRLISDVHLLPGFWKIDGYSKIKQTIFSVFDVREGENYFEFPYDWRRDNRVAARKLQRASHDWLKSWRTRSGNSDPKLILVGHSMGGLVARHFLEVLDGWRNTKALLTFGTPYRGSFNALDALANGVKKGPLDLLNFSDFVRSLTSVYQLLPVYQSYDAGDGELVRIGETSGIPNVEVSRAADALAFHREIMAQVDEHRTLSDYAENGYRIYPIVGIEQPTFQSARRAAGGVELLRTYRGNDQRGDGTVPRVSATPYELSDAARDMYSATRHSSLQNADPVLTHLAGAIMDLYIDLGEFRRGPSTMPAELALSKLALSVEDAYWPDEPVTVRVQPDREGLELSATVAEAESGRVVAQAPLLPSEDGWHWAEFAPLGGGVYRVTVGAQAGVEPAADIFVVFDQRLDMG